MPQQTSQQTPREKNLLQTSTPAPEHRHIYTSAHLHTHLQMCTHPQTCIHTDTHLNTHTDTHTHTPQNTHTHTHTHTNTNIYRERKRKRDRRRDRHTHTESERERLKESNHKNTDTFNWGQKPFPAITTQGSVLLQIYYTCTAICITYMHRGTICALLSVFRISTWPAPPFFSMRNQPTNHSTNPRKVAHQSSACASKNHHYHVRAHDHERACICVDVVRVIA